MVTLIINNPLIEKSKIKVYDANGVIFNMKEWNAYFESINPKLYKRWAYFKVQPKLSDEELQEKAELKPTVVSLYEDATNKGLYEMSLMPNIEERLVEDLEQGYATMTLTTMNKDALDFMLKKNKISDLIDYPLTLSVLEEKTGYDNLKKEDPAAFSALKAYVSGYKIGVIETYCDDQLSIVNAAAEELDARIFHFKPKSKNNMDREVPSLSAEIGKNKYFINDLLLVE